MPRRDGDAGHIRFLTLSLIAVAASWSQGAAPGPDELLRSKGLVRAGALYLLADDDLRDRIAEVRRLAADYDQARTRLTEDLAELERAERGYPEVLQKQQALEGEWLPLASDPGGPPPEGGGFDRPPLGPGGFGGPPPGGGGFDRPPPPPPRGNPRSREKGRDKSKEDSRSDFRPRIPREEIVRAYEKLQTRRTALETRIVQRQVLVEDLAGRLETTARTLEQRRAELFKRRDEIQARYATLAAESDVMRALALLNESETARPNVTLGPRADDVKGVEVLASEPPSARPVPPDRSRRVELKGMSRLTGLAGAAEALLQDLGAVSRRLQNLERDADFHTRLIDRPPHDQTRAQLEKLRAERAQFATLQNAFLQTVAALRTALDTAVKPREGQTGESQARSEILRLAYGDKAAQVLSIEHVARRRQELERSIRTGSVRVDRDKAILWVEVSLNGKPAQPMIVDSGVEDVRLPARVAAEVGIRNIESRGAGAGAGVESSEVEIRLAGGRTIRARRARLESVQVGSFTVADVECLVLPEECGETPALLGASFLRRFVMNADADAATLVLTQVPVKRK